MLTPAAQDLLERSVAWMDRYWDAGRGLLWDMGEVANWEPSPWDWEPSPWDPEGSVHSNYHIIRESAWYALGLLMRDRAGDVGRAVQALETILSYQFDEPGRVYHGTFYRAPEEPHPPEPAFKWKHYDPNWREFIITAIAVILTEYEDRLPRLLLAKLDVAIRKAVEGALARPLSARYTNIALMNAQMLVWAGDRLGERGWVEAGVAMGREVYRLFKLHDAFEEYNSPTYYGVDIYALGLWQTYCSSRQLQQMGAEMEEVLWRDIAQFYHAGLRNLAGPYDRSYGMDMRRYVALLGEWIWCITGGENAPIPDLDGHLVHAGDSCFGPLVAISEPRVPADAIPHFLAFQGERNVEHIIADSPRRLATAWLSERAMIGAEHTSLSDIGQSQFHPATVHWQADARGNAQGWFPIGWVRLMTKHPVDAVASPNRLVVTGTGPVSFLLDAPGISAAIVKPDHWQLPGLEVRVKASVPSVVENIAGEQVLVRYAPEDDALLPDHAEGKGGQAVRIVLELFVK